MIFLDAFFEKYDFKKILENINEKLSKNENGCVTLRAPHILTGIVIAKHDYDIISLGKWNKEKNYMEIEKSNHYTYELKDVIHSDQVSINEVLTHIDIIKDSRLLTLLNDECSNIDIDSTNVIEISNSDDEKSLNQISKIISVIIELYQINPEWVVREVKKLNSDIKTNNRLKSAVKGREERKTIYSAINFFEKLSKRTSFNEAYKITSKTFGIPEKDFRKLIGIRNGYRSIKI